MRRFSVFAPTESTTEVSLSCHCDIHGESSAHGERVANGVFFVIDRCSTPPAHIWGVDKPPSDGTQTMTNSTVETSVLKRDRTYVLAAIVGVVAISWIYLAIQAADMTAMPAAGMMEIQPWTSVDFVLMFIMWSIMMVGMMLPSATPAILNFAALSREHRRHGEAYVPTTVFVLGYVAVWIAFSLVATLLQWVLNTLALLSPMMVLTSPILGGVVLIAAGLYQWSPVHRSFLSKCRSPLAILNRRFGEGMAAFNMGVENGVNCLACCAVLMLVLFVGGVMNLLWVALIAAFILIEKALPYGDACARWSAVPLALGGVLVIVFHLI